MREYCVEKGISYHLTIPHIPQLNGVSERMIRTITEKARTMLNGTKLDKCFWGEAVLTATYLINRTPSNALCDKKKTPFEMWHSRKPNLKYLKVFGSTVYMHNKTRKRKFDDKSIKCILVGYETNGFKLWVLEDNKFVVARDVVVDEGNMISPEILEIEHPESDWVIQNDSMDQQDESQNECIENMESNAPNESREIADFQNESKEDKQGDFQNSKDITNILNESKEEDQPDFPNESTEDNAEVRRSERLRDKPPRSYRFLDSCLLSSQTIFSDIPNNYDEIKERDDRSKWEQAIKEELDSHLLNETWSIVDSPKNKNIIDCKWVFTIKNDELGDPVKYKARLVARGFKQKYLIDY